MSLYGPISGPGGLTVAGNGTLVLSNLLNTFAGPVIVNASAVLKLGTNLNNAFGTNTALGTFPTNYVNTGGILDLNGQTLYAGKTPGSYTNTLLIASGATITNSSPNAAYLKEEFHADCWRYWIQFWQHRPHIR